MAFEPNVVKIDPARFGHLASKSACYKAAEMAERIKAVIHEYDGIPLALAIGVLRIVEKELIE